MGAEVTTIDSCSPEAVENAIRKVNQTPGLRIRPGAEALWALFNAPSHALRRAELEAKFGALDLHFGWFCRRVAEELGASNPDTFALVDYKVDGEGNQVFALKPTVVAAMGRARKHQ
jgi:hypothetical protein